MTGDSLSTITLPQHGDCRIDASVMEQHQGPLK